MRIRYEFSLLMSVLIVVMAISLTFIAYHSQKIAVLQQVDHNLYAAARFAELMLTDNYHDNIKDAQSLTPSEYDIIVDSNNRLCAELDLQYLWSCMLIDNKVVFTSATSPSKDVARQDHAGFFEVHTNPESFSKVFSTMKPDYSSFENKWGYGRMVLLPGKDKDGRKYCFGASVSVDDVHALLHSTLMHIVWTSLVILSFGLLICFAFARKLSRPIEDLSDVASTIADGNLEVMPYISGSTELKRLALCIDRMRDSIRNKVSILSAKNAELESFTYTVSHDLKSPLITIKGFIGQMQKHFSTNEFDRVQRDMQRIEQAADKMYLLLKNLLELSRVGRVMHTPEAIPFTRIVESALSMISGELKEKNIVVHVQSGLPVVHGDEQRLIEVLQNLFSNSVRFMGPQKEPCIEVACRNDGGETVFYVRDNGEGIEKQYQKRVFELFEQLNPDTGGTGIGLALVKRIIEIHGGRIWVESEGSGMGSTFYFTISAEDS